MAERRGRLAVLSLSTLLAGCDLAASRTTTIVPRSDFAEESHRIFTLVLWVDVAIFLVVAGILVAAIVRFRERDPATLPAQVSGNPKLEFTWTVLPAIILAVIAFPTVGAIFRTQAAPPANALRVRVIGHQWWWEFEYPDLGIRTASDLHLPAGQPVVLELGSNDVIHAFWVPQLGGKRDTLPGQTNRMLLTPTTPGEYPGQCAEFCGASHANMRHLAIVHAAAEFQAWVARQQAPPAEPAEGSPAAKGREVFLRSQCVGCHAIRGVSGGGLGPDLTHFGSRRTIAGGMIVPKTPEEFARELTRWLRNPPAVKPGSLMPDLKLTDEQALALVAYLVSLK
ncbi:MAG: cytochrome c oxidase subunit II [Candidatus Rokuibacteriota bacterium]